MSFTVVTNGGTERVSYWAEGASHPISGQAEQISSGNNSLSWIIELRAPAPPGNETECDLTIHVSAEAGSESVQSAIVVSVGALTE